MGSETYYFEVQFVKHHAPIELYEKRDYVTVPSVLHVAAAIRAKIRAAHPTAEEIEIKQVKPADARHYAEKALDKMSINEHMAIRVAAAKGYCRRSNTASETAAHWSVCNKLAQQGVFKLFFLNEKGNPPAYALSPEKGVLMGEILDMRSTNSRLRGKIQRSE